VLLTKSLQWGGRGETGIKPSSGTPAPRGGDVFDNRGHRSFCGGRVSAKVRESTIGGKRMLSHFEESLV